MQVPFKPIEFLSRDIKVERRSDGTVVLQSNHPLQPYARHVPALLAKWAAEVPDRLWLAQRRGPEREWLKVTYGEARKQVDSVTQALLDRGFGPDRPVMILSSNSIEFALLTMAAMQARAPVAPVSPAYSVMSQDHAKLKYVFDLIKPGLVFVQNGEIYARALAALDLTGVLLVHVDKPVPGMQSLPWSELVATPATDAVAKSIEAIGPKTVGKFLLTSGSTGMPKAVINTQRNDERQRRDHAAGMAARAQSERSGPGGARLVAVEPHDGRQRVVLGEPAGEGGTMYHRRR
jgi:feruloyl-CoA synthase